MTIRLLMCAVGLMGVLGAPVVAQPAEPAAESSTQVARHHAMVERRIGELHSRLQITAAEQPSFDAVAAVMRANADHMTGMMQMHHHSVAGLSAVEQMKAYEGVAQAHAEDMQRLVPAFQQLYDELTPEQKKLADNSFRDFARSGGRHGG